MITIPHSQLRSLRSIFRRAGVGKSSFANNSITLRAGSDGLRIAAVSHRVAIEYHRRGRFDAEELIVPVDLFTTCEGRTDDAVTLEPRGAGKVLASWNDHGIPQVVEFLAPSGPKASPMPPLPESFLQNSPALLGALQAALAIAESDRTRYALDCLQLRGSQGKIAVTDGRQILVQSGFQFPWTDDLLVPAAKVLASRDFPADQPVSVGVLDHWIALRLGSWTVWLRIDREGRYPTIDDLIRQPSGAVCRLVLEPRDAEFLAQALPRLPGDDAENHPITLDLNGQAVVRAKAATEAPPTELVLSRSTLAGEALAINSNREFIVRALGLGFREICFFGPRSPALCDDGQRQYVWGLLEPDDTVRSNDDAVRIDSATDLPQPTSDAKPTRRRLTVTPAEPASTPVARPARTKRQAQTENVLPIDQALAVRAILREALAQTNQLLSAVKREKRRSRLLASTMASLKQLQKVAS